MHRRSLFVASLLIPVLAVSVAQAQFQGLAPDTLTLDDLSAFRSPSENWSVADSAWGDPNQVHHLQTGPGTGVVVNEPADGEQGHLVTGWTHGDLEIEMDVLMPRGSNSGIYLQGRYEVQLLDSWGVKRPTYGDMGGIYQRWDENRPKGERGFDGHPPRKNVARAPGLWQHLKIDFRAPRFNEAGQKVEDARFEKVTLNGVVIHRNISVSGPTRAAAYEEEAATGPLLIQGDHGPVAIKNVRYKRYRPGAIELSDLRYKRYDASLDQGLSQLDTVDVAVQGTTDRLSRVVLGKDDDFAALFEGTLTVPRTGTYAFELLFHWITEEAHLDGPTVGGGRLRIDDELVVSHAGTSRSATGSVDLREGTHRFHLLYFKNRWYAPSPRITLFVEGPHFRRRTYTTDPVPVGMSDPVRVTPETEPTLLRSFFRHGGEKRTHVISAGSPNGAHYAYDLNQGSLLRVWKGGFLRANPMWEGRGHQQRAVPLGSGPVFSGSPPIALLPERSAPWPDSLQQSVSHEYLGYRLDGQERPSFRYTFEGLEVTDRFRADSSGGRLTRRVRLAGEPTSDQIFVRLLRAETLRRTDGGRFVAGDRTFYVEVSQPAVSQLHLRRSREERELLVPVSPEKLPLDLQYEIIW